MLPVANINYTGETHTTNITTYGHILLEPHHATIFNPSVPDFALKFIKYEEKKSKFIFFELYSVIVFAFDRPAITEYCHFFGIYISFCGLLLIPFLHGIIFGNQKKDGKKKKNVIANKIQSMNLTAFENFCSNNKWFFL